MTRNALIVKALLAAMLAAALAAPAALADPPQGHRADAASVSGPVRDQPDGYQPQLAGDAVDRFLRKAGTAPDRVAVAATPQSHSFDWGDMAIGIAIGVALSLLLGLAAQIGRGRTRPAHS